jgi:hypothetical protein
MAVDVQFDKRFAPAEATRGQFVPIDSSTINNYPTGDSEGLSRGRYAQLNYIVGSEPGALNIALSGGTVILPVSTVNISEPVRVENEPGDRLLVTTQEPLSTIITNQIIGVALCAGDIEFATVAVSNLAEISSIEINNFGDSLTNTTQVCSQTVAAQSSAVVNFSPTINFLEIYNRDTNDNVYVAYDASLTYAQINARGIPIEGEAYFSIDREISTLIVTNPDTASVDVSIFGHYRA